MSINYSQKFIFRENLKKNFSENNFFQKIYKGIKRNGAGDGIRTHDLLVTSQLLYQLELLRQVLSYYIMKCVKV